MRLFILVLLSGLACASTQADAADIGWQRWGNDDGGSRYSAADVIDRSNVANLAAAWTYHTGDHGDGIPSRENRAFEATPVLVDDRLIFSTPYGHIHAIDARTGKGLWQHAGALPTDRWYSENTSRGVSIWRDAQAVAGAVCAVRVFFGTLDARLIALDAATGVPCSDFGNRGTVDLNADTRPRDAGDYQVSSPPAIWNDLVITGSSVGDNRAVDVELGIVRAFDARSGKRVWLFDPIPRRPDNPVYAEWTPAAAAATGAANAWSVLSVDAARGLVFVPVGSAAPDFFGGERTGDNRHANSVVALNAATGAVVWARQLVHHDVWDYDIPAQPVLFDLVRDGKPLPALIQPTKMGMLFVLHRETGQPLFPIEERAVPQGGVPGEVLSPTQPFSMLPPLSPQGPLRADDAWGLTPIDRNSCAERIAALRSEGIYTPPSLEGTLMYPGYAGGSNWGSVSVDATRQYVFANTLQLPFIVQLIPRAQFGAMRAADRGSEWEYAEQAGTPYGIRRMALLSPLGIPCTAPPWGLLTAIDLGRGRIAWQVPLGTTRDLAPWPFWYIDGVPNLGGSVVTASGLLFIGAATDNFLRAFDVDNGTELWRGRLPAGGQATPMTFVLDGRQYVVIAAGGHGGAGTTHGDSVIAFALPER